MKIPFMDLKRQYAAIKPEIDSAIAEILEKTAFIGGPIREAFEKEFAEAMGAKFAIGVGNGTDSLFLAMKALGLKSGDEVLVPANSFIATSETVTAAGGTPVFCDIKEDTFNIDYDLAEQILEKRAHTRSGRIRGIIPVHLYGRVVDMDRIRQLCDKFELFCIEDTAQAHLAQWNGNNAGTMGTFGSYSFYPGKNLGAYGDGGALVTNDASLAEKVRKIANHGRINKYDHEIEGFNSRLDTLQAAILRVKLKHLPSWTRTRQEKALVYDELLTGISQLTPPARTPLGQHVYHLYVVRVPNRDAVQARLAERGIETIVHYPTALPFLKAYAYMGHKKTDFPVSAKLQNEILSLPFFPEITLKEQEYVAHTLREILN